MVKDLNYHHPLGESDHLCLTFSVEYNQCNTPFSPLCNVYKADCFSGNFYSIMDRPTPMTTPTKRGKNVYMATEAIRLNGNKD